MRRKKLQSILNVKYDFLNMQYVSPLYIVLNQQCNYKKNNPVENIGFS